MKTDTKSILYAATCVAALFGSALSANAADVSREEFEALSQRVEELETALRIDKNAQVEEIATEAVASIPMSKEEKSTLIENVVTTIQAREEAANFPWMDLAKWEMLKKGMSPEAVVAILGEPTLNEPSLHKRIDTVYTYQGRRVATAKRTEGIVRFYKGKLAEFEAPEL